MSSIRAQNRKDQAKLVVFVGIAAVITAYLVIVTGQIRPGERDEYHAVFDNVSGLTTGSQVRVASVEVGKVTSVQVQEDATVKVGFTVADDITLDETTTATVRYRNLIGDRYIALERGDDPGAALEPGATLPASRTESALDIDTLLNGFKPLFAGLNAQQINQLSAQLIEVLQGQESAVGDLIATVGSFTTTIGSQQELVTSVLGNLNAVMGTLDDRSGDLDALITQLSRLAAGYDGDAESILDSAAAIGDGAGEVDRLLDRARGDLTPVLKELATTTGKVNEQADVLDDVLNALPAHYARMVGPASYGNFFNFFLCGVRVQLADLGGGKPLQTPWIESDVARCKR
ncbi:MCE family protein [Nocardioides daeguensis]|uniref:Virulence factor Mce family protein n=1 Tax=Nocardioides daeguensis TaxID=908359 RepID=A0ABP6US50_9ACTN|nr:MlaD family protein [Nocardioides daeguensis]MBV6725566.1 MCE family protein [Nocardioides daeguensis]MCR1771426.1 MCE family protein [Nocardioides daeguensis]